MLLFWDRHVMALETLVCHNQDHNDPFDRTMIARAKADGLKFVTHDYKISFYEEPCDLYYLASQYLNLYGGTHILDYYSENEI